jgi:hypothetical protein
MTENATRNTIAYCDEKKRLLEGFAQAVSELISFHEQQFQSIFKGDEDLHRFDLLIHVANEKKRDAKYALMRHLEEHSC